MVRQYSSESRRCNLLSNLVKNWGGSAHLKQLLLNNMCRLMTATKSEILAFRSLIGLRFDCTCILNTEIWCSFRSLSHSSEKSAHFPLFVINPASEITEFWFFEPLASK